MLRMFDHVMSFLTKGAINTVMADLNAVDVGINEMFRQLRSAKLSHVADKFAGK